MKKPVVAKSSPLVSGMDEQQGEQLDQDQPAAQDAQLTDAIAADFSDISEEQQSRNAGERADQLGKYIHEAISRQKRYPYMARRMRREGLVRLNFVMHPDGQVTDIAIVQSSRFQALDTAARQAVQAISPFHLAAEYLQMQHDYNVDIDFRLN
jgi:TonB family protein